MPFCHAADIISAVEFDYDGLHLATGDRGGRVVLFERVNPHAVGAKQGLCMGLHGAWGSINACNPLGPHAPPPPPSLHRREAWVLISGLRPRCHGERPMNTAT